MTTTRFATLAAALAFTAAALSPAAAAPRPTAWTGVQPYGIEATGSLGAPAGGLVGYENNPYTCPMSSAAEGNATQHHFPVKQHGQTSGGNTF
ncbi:hypothetical protein MKK84_21420 [Methylobacterium sp. E-065]|uniref:hypothetical protein n=1 Tax=Methylobacterium sp. E-065 TaxID=2836583 RepID=UPI001FBA1EAD|nr:hypothetical protein [Methylobacterium sp. E-065]MCJ2019961.1 hypothetical protein [Methylobacterium sp. E-065]